MESESPDPTSARQLSRNSRLAVSVCGVADSNLATRSVSMLFSTYPPQLRRYTLT